MIDETYYGTEFQEYMGRMLDVPETVRFYRGVIRLSEFMEKKKKEEDSKRVMKEVGDKIGFLNNSMALEEVVEITTTEGFLNLSDNIDEYKKPVKQIVKEPTYRVSGEGALRFDKHMMLKDQSINPEAFPRRKRGTKRQRETNAQYRARVAEWRESYSLEDLEQMGVLNPPRVVVAENMFWFIDMFNPEYLEGRRVTIRKGTSNIRIRYSTRIGDKTRGLGGHYQVCIGAGGVSVDQSVVVGDHEDDPAQMKLCEDYSHPEYVSSYSRYNTCDQVRKEFLRRRNKYFKTRELWRRTITHEDEFLWKDVMKATTEYYKAFDSYMDMAEDYTEFDKGQLTFDNCRTVHLERVYSFTEEGFDRVTSDPELEREFLTRWYNGDDVEAFVASYSPAPEPRVKPRRPRKVRNPKKDLEKGQTTLF